MFTSFRREVNGIMKSVIQLVYFMRGSISYNEMMQMTFVEREMVGDFIKERLEQESKRSHPNY